jgi:hypothetical protein
MNITAGTAGAVHGRSINNGPRITRRQWEPKMTNFFMRTVRNVSVVLAVAASLSAVTSTSSFAFSAEAQSMCTGDAFRLCSSEIPNIPKITACMVKNRANLSSGCRTVMDRDFAAQKSKVAAQ